MADEVSAAVSRPVMVWVEQLFRAHVEGVFNVAYRILRNRSDAEDVAQATFVKAFTRIDQLADPSKARAWLFQVAYREAIAALRRRRDIPTDPHDTPIVECPMPGPAEQAVASAVAVEVSRALWQLAPDERMAVVLRDVEGLAMAEVADIVGVGLSAAKMRVHRGRQSLRSLLESSEVR